MMDTTLSQSTTDSADGPFEFTEQNVRKLRGKYIEETRHGAPTNNPIKVVMKLIMEAAIERDSSRRANISIELSKFLTRSDGLITLFLALIDFDSTSQKVTTHNQRFLAVSNIITRLPKLSMPYENYCRNIIKQLQPLLVLNHDKYSALASLIVKSLLESNHADKQPDTIQQIVLGPFLRPFRDPDSLIKLDQSIVGILNLTQNCIDPRLFADIYPNLFYCLLTLSNTPSQLKKYLKSILVNILTNFEPGPACCLIEQTLFYDNSKCDIYEVLTEADQISLRIDGQATERLKDTCSIRSVQITLELLEACDNDPLVLEFFFHFHSKMWTSSDRETAGRCTMLVEPLLENTVEESCDGKLNLLSSILSSGEQALELISKALSNYMAFFRSEKPDNSKESLDLVKKAFSQSLDILELLCATYQGHDASYIIHRKIVPILEELGSIFTAEKFTSSRDIKDSLNSLMNKLCRGRAESKGYDNSTSEVQVYGNLIKDLNDKLVPVRVHALVSFKNLILANDRHTMSRIPQLYDFIEGTLADQEPYVFLASINLLAEMSLRKTDIILPRILKLYTDPSLELSQRINFGEVLVRLVRQLNEMSPSYAQTIICSILSQTKSEEELMRMSSLTNLGEICRNLKHGLYKYIQDVLSCVERALNEDTLQVKCAAIELLRTILMGSDKFTAESIQRELRSIYTLLKKLRHKTLDDKLCLLNDLALDEIDRLAKEMLGVPDRNNKEETLVKNIKVMSLLNER